MRRPLVTWTLALFALLAAHDLTHLLDDGLDTSAAALATVAVPQWIVLAGVLWVIVRGDRARATGAALLLAAGVVAGFVVVHLLPFSPAAYYDLEPSAASWVLAIVPPLVALVVAALAWAERRAAGAAPAPA
jgi:hypothetical protein